MAVPDRLLSVVTFESCCTLLFTLCSHIPVVTIFTSSAHPSCHTFSVCILLPTTLNRARRLTRLTSFTNSTRVSSPLSSSSLSQCWLVSFQDVYACNLASNCPYCHDAFRSQSARTCWSFVNFNLCVSSSYSSEVWSLLHWDSDGIRLVCRFNSKEAEDLFKYILSWIIFLLREPG
jgi:hypothetical protein